MDKKSLLFAAYRSEKVRYLLVGGYNTVFGYGLFVALILLFGDRTHYLVVIVISHVVAVTNAYYAYRLFVFRNGKGGFQSYLWFHYVYLASLGFNLAAFQSASLVDESIRSARRDRGHAVSLLYRCRLAGPPDPRRRYTPEAPQPDQWLWHERYPENLIPEQRANAAFMG